ncbi:MAG: phage integrase SAM-like domain-containing protein, partial [Alistipes sp.]|nr:phage integrase SAM-like domain-containing protein [Alistipes sp.]
MATFKTCIFAHQKKADGSYLVKLRITHHRQSRWISTNLVAKPEDLTRGLKIKNEMLNRKCRELTDACIDICNVLGYTIETMGVDELVTRVKSGLTNPENFQLDFVKYMYNSAEKMTPGTGSIYRSAANALIRYTGRRNIDIQEINAGFIRGFIQFLEAEPSQSGANRKSTTSATLKPKGHRAIPLYLSRIKTIWNRAKEEFNDEELGILPIKGDPFKSIRLKTPPPTDKRAVSPEIIQQIINPGLV